MKTVTEVVKKRAQRPVRVLQFGEGNFLRAFVDYMIDIANEKGLMDAGIAVVKAIPYGALDRFEKQQNLYTVVLRGKQNGAVVDEARIVTSVQQTLGCYENPEAFWALAALDTLEFVVSNTTEAGIVLDEADTFAGMPATYPGKLTKFLYTRYTAFAGAMDKGLVILPVELIENNGGKLKACVLALARIWALGEDFAAWLNAACTFCSTLVDRIVTGYPRAEAQAICQTLGYTDELLDVAEPFGLWVIESDRDISARLPLDKAGLPVVFTGDQRPYRERKVRILNGAHTSTVLLGWLAGCGSVGECMADPVVRPFMQQAVQGEILPCVPLPRQEVEAFAAAVFERFENPFIYHKVLDISLNSVSKWKARVLPSLLDSLAATGVLPEALSFSFAALLAFYTGTLEDGAINAVRADGTAYAVRDDAAVLEFMAAHCSGPAAGYAAAVAGNTGFWGCDLRTLPGFVDAVTGWLQSIRANGARAAAAALLEG